MGGGGGGVVINIQYFKFNPAHIKYRKLQKYIIYCCTSTEKVTPPPPQTCQNATLESLKRQPWIGCDVLMKHGLK